MATPNPAKFFMKSDHADVIFVVDNEKIPGHREILAESCPYFDRLLLGDFLESESKKVEINGASAKVFKEVMRFAYKKQIEVKDWTIEDLLSVLAVAHEYQFQPLFLALVNVLEMQTLDFGAWALVNSAAALYDSNALRRKCLFFIEDKTVDFLHQKDLDKFSADIICSMFDTPKISACNQDELLGALFKWTNGQSASEIMTVLQKICFNKLSPATTAVVVNEFFSVTNSGDESKFWTKCVPLLKEALNCIVRLDSIVLPKDSEVEFLLPYNKGSLLCSLRSDRIEFWFRKEKSLVEIAVKQMEFESSTKFSIERIIGWNLKKYLKYRILNNNVNEPTSNDGWFEYSAVFSYTGPVWSIYIDSLNFESISEIILRNFAIY